MFSPDGGYTWTGPHYVLANAEAPEPDFVELPDGRLLVAHDRAGTYGISLIDEKKGKPGRPNVDDPAWHDVDPHPVVARAEPVGRIPTVEFASVLDIGGFKSAGQLQCLNVHESDREEVQGIRPGQVKTVRLVEGLPLSLEDGKR